MLFAYRQNGEYKEISELTSPDEYLWLDVISPTPSEESLIEKTFGIDMPTREEMAEIELSSRLYEEDGVLFLTAVVVTRADTDSPANEAVTFIITDKNIITLRYQEMGAFKQYITRVNRQKPQTHVEIYNGLIEAIINRTADIMEKIGANIDATSRRVFREKKERTRYEEALSQAGISGDMISKARESLMTLGRMITFATSLGNREEKAHLEVLMRDLNALSVHVDFLSNKAMFLLDATLGMINYEQNNIIKIFTLAATIFLPPTLISTIYGMNFASMPELNWHYGYPLALFLMLVSAYLPYRYFKKKGWL
jgi:magnesium transporter